MGPFGRLLFVVSVLAAFVMVPAADAESESQEASTAVGFTFEVANATHKVQLEPTGTLTLVPVTGPAEPRTIEVGDGAAGEALGRVRLPVQSSWLVHPAIEGYWAPSEVLDLSGDTETYTQVVRLWQLATFHGRIDAESEVGELDALVARFEPSPAQPGAPKKESFNRASVQCPIEESGHWHCSVPAETLDLSLHAQGMVPHYFWSLQVSEDGTPSDEGGLDLGLLDFVPGASLAGRVETEDGLPPEGRTRIRVVPRIASGGAGLDPGARQIQRAEAVTEADGRGFFQLAGLAPVSYVLEASHPDFAAARIHPVEIFERAETRLQGPLVLRPPIDLTLQIAPSLDWMTERWTVRVMQQSEFSAGFDDRPIFEDRATEEGRVHLRDQRPGIFSVTVEDSLGNRHYQNDHLVVEGSGSFTERIEVELKLVRGTVRYGDTPIPATLYFGGRYGATRVRMEANAEGRFRGLLPRTGSWRVDVGTSDPPLETELRVVVSEDSPIELKIPATEVTGVVVQPDGLEVPGARVTLQKGEFSARSRTDRQGRFTFRGFESGAVVLTARASLQGTETFSDQVVEVVQQDQTVESLRLVLRHSVRPFRGRVVAANGPVAGAQVHVSPVQPPLAQSGFGSTDLGGWFEVDVAADAEVLQITVLPPGYALTTRLVARNTEEPTIQVPRLGGTLTIVDDREPEEAGGKILLADNLAIPWGLLFQWARGNGVALSSSSSSLVVPKLQPGEYVLCRLSSEGLDEELATGGSWQGAKAGCKRGYLGAGAQLELAVSTD